MSISIDDILDAAAHIERSNRQCGKGPSRKETCINGHDLAEHGVQKYKVTDAGRKVKNGRYCLECKREAQRQGPARPNAQKPRRPGRNPHADDYRGRR